ncbi:pectinesterase-like isoform X2 [Rutidosis leptorrhynchoides]|uniref:pectinesterase-like isoform X2 n=1 Tax=Rutidosis leptorrhynchoides TaxID=125765 RepID=UPI003A99EEA1
MATHQPLLGNNIPKSSSKKSYLFLFLFLATLIGTTTLFTIQYLINNNNDDVSSSSATSPKHLCDTAHDQKSCLDTVNDLAVSSNKTLSNDHVGLLQILLEKSILDIQKTVKVAKLVRSRINDQENMAMADCVELLELSIDRIMYASEALAEKTAESRANAHSWLSSVLTNHFTCYDGLSEPTRTLMQPWLDDLISKSRTSLAILVGASSGSSNDLVKLVREFPSWVTSRDRKLLEGGIQANVVVAKDGSGKYKTVKEAVDAAPVNSKTRYVIYVKKGVYNENFEIAKSKKNLMLVGDGMDLTIITGSLNVVDGSTTFKSATVAAVGDGFMAQDIWFQNTAGPQKHQAVALRVGADQSVFYRCKIDAYQDTLYTHTNRQFYRDCYITGTVDFIFGNAAVVFQNCKIVARKPMSNQNNMVTAQGREDPNQITGTSIQNCDVIASSDLGPVKTSIKTYLGRPWKAYSRTVVMQSNIGDHVDPTGWSIWEGDFALKTLYYGEYMNKGVGAGTSKRVNWPGFKVITDVAEAKKFTVAELIQGGAWLQSTGVAYTEGL